MQEMLGFERIRRPGTPQHVDRQIEIVQPLALATVEADADRVADGGDPGRGHLRVVGQHSRIRRPAYAWARVEQSLEIVGMELDQARQQPVPSQFVGADPAALDHLGDPPVAHDQRTSDHRIVGHDPGVGKDQLGAHALPFLTSGGFAR